MSGVPSDIPAELVRMLDHAAGKIHSAEGPVLATLARILARHEEMIRETVATEQADVH